MNARLFSFLLLAFFSNSTILYAKPVSDSIADRREADRLLSMLAKTTGSTRANALASLAKLALTHQLDSSVALSSKAIEAYRKANDRSGLLTFLLEQGENLCLAGVKEKGLDLFRQAIKLNQQMPFNDSSQLKLFRHIGDIFFLARINSDSALFYHQKAFQFVSDSLTRAKLFLALGKDFYDIGLKVKALNFLFKAERILIKVNQPKILADTYYHIAHVFADDGALEKATLFCKKALNIFIETKNINGQANVMNGIIVIQFDRGLYDSALLTIASTHALLNKNNLDRIIERKIYLDTYKGECLLKLGKLDDAITVLKKAYESGKNFNREYTECSILMDLAEACLKKNQLKEAENYALASYDIIQRTKYWSKYPEISGILSQIYASSGEFKKAYHYRTQQHTSYDSLYKQESRSKMKTLEKDYELAKKDDELKVLEANGNLAQQKQLALFVGLSLLIAFSFTIGYFLFLARRRNNALTEANKIITEQAERIANTAEQKSTFFANISHELRTPVTLINGTLEQIKDNPNNAFENRLDMALRSSRKLKDLVDEVFNLTKSESGKAPLAKLKEVELLPLLTRIVFSFDSLIEKKQLNLDLNASSLEGVFVLLDEDKFEKIINNLMSNAIKFNYQGGIISVRGEYHERQAYASIIISDTGSGISLVDLPHVFERFYQGNTGEHKNSGGLGVGLALVKEYTEMLGGKVSVRSAEGTGTKFYLELPVLETRNQSSIQKRAWNFQDDHPKISFDDFESQPFILLVEDNEDMQVYIQDIFRNNGKIIGVSNGQQALEWLKENSPDLIITDLMMPVMDGYELIGHLKSSKKQRLIPVIILTAKDTQKDKLRGVSLGVDEFLTKPFNPIELKIRVFNLLTNLKSRQQWLLPTAIGQSQAEEQVPAENEDFLRKVEEFVLTHLKEKDVGNLALANQFAMSDRKLHRICGRLTGMTPGQLIKEIKLKKAYAMLAQREVNKVTELVAKLGFSDVAYFSRQFAERFGKRPTEMLTAESDDGSTNASLKIL